MRSISHVAAAASFMLLAGANAPAATEPFTLLIYETDAQLAARTHATQPESYWGAYAAYGGAMAQAGILRGGAVLQPAHDRSTVRMTGGRLEVVVPAAATAQLGGYFVIDVPDRDTALAWAGRAPAVDGGAVEVRPAFAAPTMR